jgi:2-keto-4-pentenoate hydratase/2-oxohepta-3-ene-1,7-dioic acid hydratase in catechol pathway
MKIIRYRFDGVDSYGVLDNTSVKQIKGEPFAQIELTGQLVEYSDVKLLSPVMPSKIVAVGLNYVSHAKEINQPIPERPLLFLKPPSSIINPFENIVRPKQSNQVEFEAELAIVIKKECRNITKEEVADYVFGFTCVNDVSARDLQFIESQWTRAKSFDTFNPIGPWIETDYDWRNKQLKSILNGRVMQDSNTNDFIFDVEEVVSYISSIMTLMPGDIIPTGTPFGVGPMVSGDLIEIEIEGLGVLKNGVVDE